jgi:hypothetical protein
MAAAGPFVFSQKTKLFMFSASGLLGATATNFRLALITSAWTPAPTTDEKYGDLSANQIATAGQTAYVSGGATLTSVVLNQTGGVVKFTSAAQVWTADGTGIPAWRYGVVYYLGTLNAIVNPLVGYFLGDSAPADVPLTTNTNTLTFTPNASGIVSAT